MKIILLFVSIFFTFYSVAKTPIHKGYYLFDRYKIQYPGAYWISTDRFGDYRKFEIGIYEDAKFTKRVGKIWFSGEQSSIKGAARGGVIYKNKQYCEYLKVYPNAEFYLLVDMGAKSYSNPKTGFSCSFLHYSVQSYCNQDCTKYIFEATDVTDQYIELCTDRGDFFYLKRSDIVIKENGSSHMRKPDIYPPFSSDYKEKTKSLFEHLSKTIAQKMSADDFFKKYQVKLIYRKDWPSREPTRPVTIIDNLSKSDKNLPKDIAEEFKDKKSFSILKAGIAKYLQMVFTTYYPPRDFYYNSPLISQRSDKPEYQFNFFKEQLKKDYFQGKFKLYDQITEDHNKHTMFNFIRFNVKRNKKGRYELGPIVVEILILDEYEKTGTEDRGYTWFTNMTPQDSDD